MLSSQVRVAVLRDNHEAGSSETRKADPRQTSSILAQLNAADQKIQYKGLVALENVIRSNPPTNNASKGAASSSIFNHCDACVQAILRYVKRDDIPTQHECKAWLVLA
jgi:hypothetical protein